MARRRKQNERIWPHWQDLPESRRRYWLRREGFVWGHQVLFKEVVFNPETQLEQTTRMWQEIYDDHGELVESHQKYPTDTGHRKL
jgi:hypothetical protein